jgi:hypothetical protein
MRVGMIVWLAIPSDISAKFIKPAVFRLRWLGLSFHFVYVQFIAIWHANSISYFETTKSKSYRQGGSWVLAVGFG